jgi:hypothetical protein
MTATNADIPRVSTSDALDQLQRAAAPAIKEGKRQAGVLLDQSGELIHSVSSGASDIAAAVGKGLIAYTKRNPLTALILALGAGALLVGVTKSMQPRR